jgi:DNA/RNA-binding domain of Phe-tRNA-synthetase-like protein
MGVVVLRSLVVRERDPRLVADTTALTEELRRALGDRQPSTLPIVERTRRLYHQVGLDPTKHRPSSEKLLRRVLRRQPFPEINTFVDAMNLVSLKLQLPLGLYDWDQVAPPVLLRIGQPNETFRGLTGELVGLEGKILLVDGEGAFGNPTHDSDRTRITERTVRALVVLFAPADTPREQLLEGVEEVIRLGKTYCDGQAVASGVLP